MEKQIFLVLAHKNVSLLRKLIRILQLYNGYIIVHYDAKSNIAYKKEFEKEIKEGGLYFIQDNIKVYWGSFSIIRATFLLIDYAINNFKDRGHFHLLSEQCIPVKSPFYFHNFFRENKHTNFIKAFELPDARWSNNGGLNRIYHYHFNQFFNQKGNSIKDKSWQQVNSVTKRIQSFLHFKRSSPVGFPKLYGGSAWWSLSNECICYMNDFYKKNNAFRRRFLFTHLPDEMFMQTIFMNSPFSKTEWSNRNLRYIDWRKEFNEPCPRILNENDHWALINKPDILFARKVDSSDYSFIEKIEQAVIKM